jgi:hypothetical protein
MSTGPLQPHVPPCNELLDMQDVRPEQNFPQLLLAKWSPLPVSGCTSANARGHPALDLGTGDERMDNAEAGGLGPQDVGPSLCGRLPRS